jgi:hypothetical protein
MLTVNIKAGFSLFIIFILVVSVLSCDSMEDDVIPDGPDVTIDGDEVYVMADGSTYIDLYSKIKTNSPVTLDISVLPKKGTLTEVASGLLKYSPDEEFISGQDAFSFNVLGAGNSLLKADTIKIIVKDSIDLPCYVYPRDDWFTTQDFPIELNVLLNDLICGDSADISLEIHKPAPNYPPYHGTATVTDRNTILYTSTSATVEDKVLYKVSRKSDQSVVGFATAYIERRSSCDSLLAEVAVSIERDSTHYPIIDSLYLDLPDSVQRCGKIFSELAIVDGPHDGTYSFKPGGIVYYFELTKQKKSISDSIKYLLCAEQDCLTGVAKIKIN